MIIDPQGTICGFPSMEVRKALKGLRGGSGGSALYFQEKLRASLKDTKEFIKRLQQEGFLTLDPDLDREYWKCTIKGNALGQASARPISRKTADRILRGFLERVHEVNANDYYLHVVPVVFVFGSYLSDKEKIGDIDLAFDLEQRPRIYPNAYPGQDFGNLTRERTHQAWESGKSFSNTSDQVCWSSTEIYLFLKSRKRLSFHHTLEVGDLKRNGHSISCKCVYKAESLLPVHRTALDKQIKDMES